MEDDERGRKNLGYFFSFQYEKELFCAFQAFLPEMFLCESMCVILDAGASVYVWFCGSRLRCRWNKARCEC